VVNRPKIKGTKAESAVEKYLKDHGWPYAERRSLKGALDKGDMTGVPGLCVEVKYAGKGLKLGQWLTETGIERINAGADHGILVIKPPGLGDKRTGQWYAAMVGKDFDLLAMRTTVRSAYVCPLRIAHGEPTTYTAATLRQELPVLVRENQEPDQAAVLTLLPPGSKEKPETWYRVTVLDHMIRLLWAAGYGDPNGSAHRPEQP